MLDDPLSFSIRIRASTNAHMRKLIQEFIATQPMNNFISLEDFLTFDFPMTHIVKYLRYWKCITRQFTGNILVDIIKFSNVFRGHCHIRLNI